MNELDKLKEELEDLRQTLCFDPAFLRDLLQGFNSAAVDAR